MTLREENSKIYEMTEELKFSVFEYLITFFYDPMFDVKYKKKFQKKKNFVIQML